MIRVRALMWLALFLFLGSAPAAQPTVGLQDLELVQKADGVHITGIVVVDADVRSVRDILVSPQSLPSLNPRVETVEVLDSKPGHAYSTVRITAQRCLLWACSRYEWVQSIFLSDNGDVMVTFEPSEGSSVSDGEVRYGLQTSATGETIVSVVARIVHAIDLPPLVGPLVMRRALAEDMKVWSRNLSILTAAHGPAGTVVAAIATNRASSH